MGCFCSKTYDFTNKTFDNTENFSLKDRCVKCRVVDIYDGDTCTCVIPFNGNFYKFIIRLADIDTCELKSTNMAVKEHAYKARLRLYRLITKDMSNIELNISRKELRKKLNANVYIVNLKCGDFEKYGRLLGWIYDINMTKYNYDTTYNNILVQEKLATLYDGGTKLTENEQMNLIV